jgi:hypothetical protein|nr:MAG TPA: hypothetical protein [Caudoviricetes sp.]
MNMQEIIEQLKLIQAGLTQDDNNKSKRRLDLVIEELKKPISLADFLGWEEDKVYIFDNYKLKISNGSVLYFSKFSSKWEIHIPKSIIDLRKAILEVQE